MSKVKKAPAVTRSAARKRMKPDKSAKLADFRISELDPQAKCGPGTSVQFLYRVVERTEGATTHHLVFFDQHGWYCDHGKECPAVAQAKRHLGWSARD